MRKTLQPNICFIGVGPGGGEGGFNDVSSMSSPFGPAVGPKGMTPDAMAVAGSTMSTNDMAAVADVQDQTTGGLFSAPAKENPVAAALPGGLVALGLMGLHNVATNANVNTGLHAGNPNAGGFFSGEGGNNGDGQTGSGPDAGGNGDAPQGLAAGALAAAQKASPLPDPVAPAAQTISSPESPEQQAAAVQARRKKKSRPLINGGFLGTTAGGVSDTGQTQTPTGPSLGTTTSLGPGAGFVRKKNTF
jgi:hypothetical protein